MNPHAPTDKNSRHDTESMSHLHRTYQADGGEL